MTVSTPRISGPTASPYEAGACAVDVRALVASYGERRALDGLDLRVPAGAVYGVLGPNGAGKSTLLSVLIGRRAVQAGEVRLFGERMTASLRARIGMVFQHPSLDPHMTVSETLALQGRLFGLTGGAIEARSRELLRTVGLSERAPDLTRTLSGGMRRRLELARALLPSPDLLLLDEPTLALDPDSRLALWEYLVAANRAGVTLLLATNDVAEAERYCDTVALIDGGRVVLEGSPAALKAGLRRESVRVEWKQPLSAQAADGIAAWQGVGSIRTAGLISHATVDAAAPFLARLFTERGDDVRAVHVDPTTLEDVYFQAAGKRLHGQEEAQWAG